MFLPEVRRLLQQIDVSGGDVGTNSSSNGLQHRTNGSFNATGGFFIEDETDLEGGFSDMKTVFLACIATFIPLVIALVAAFGIRHVWRKLRDLKAEGYHGVLQREESSDPLAVKSLTASGNLLADEVAVENGATKTTTTFSASSSPHQNNIFVVEVQHGAAVVDQATASCYRTDTSLYPKINSSEDDTRKATSQRAEIHPIPDIEAGSDEDMDDELEDVEEVDEDEEETVDGTMEARYGSTNTGLSQSDLSISSAGSNNPSYRYGNQLGYECGHYGYPQYVGYTTSDVPNPFSKCQTGKKEGNAAKSSEVEEEKYQEEQRKLGNGVTSNGEVVGRSVLTRAGSLPQKGGDATSQSDKLDAVKLNPVKEAVDDANRRENRLKRGSLPIITPDLYTKINQTKNMIIDKTTRPGPSPKFEKFSNENSPMEEGHHRNRREDEPDVMKAIPEVGVISQHYENEAFLPAEQTTS